MNKLFLLNIIFYFLNTPLLHANFAEFFGAGPSSISIGNQGDGDPSNPTNNYYNPSLLAWNKNISFAFSSSAIQHNLKEITNITIKNDTNNRSFSIT